MPRERLTRNEIAWLLAQEARGAAKALRDEVSAEKTIVHPEETRLTPVESTLDTLDDAIDMLSALNARTPSKARRGRIDLAALLCDVAPQARIGIEPGAGTEILGDETDLRRMLGVLCSQATLGGTSETEVRIRREGGSIKISVDLGPDVSATGELERRWLSRMALRHGGRFDLEGGTQSVVFEAEPWLDEQREVHELRRELEQAEQLREAYARELAGMLASGEIRSEPPQSLTMLASADRLSTVRGTCLAIENELRALAESLAKDALTAKASADQEVLAADLVLKASTLAALAEELVRVRQTLFED